jgi:glutamate dehydrogenase
MQNNEGLLKRWYHMMSEFKTSSNHDFAKFSVALRELMLLSMKSSQQTTQSRDCRYQRNMR